MVLSKRLKNYSHSYSISFEACCRRRPVTIFNFLNAAANRLKKNFFFPFEPWTERDEINFGRINLQKYSQNDFLHFLTLESTHQHPLCEPQKSYFL